jgi:hypothetical protein
MQACRTDQSHALANSPWFRFPYPGARRSGAPGRPRRPRLCGQQQAPLRALTARRATHPRPCPLRALPPPPKKTFPPPRPVGRAHRGRLLHPHHARGRPARHDREPGRLLRMQVRSWGAARLFRFCCGPPMPPPGPGPPHPSRPSISHVTPAAPASPTSPRPPLHLGRSQIAGAPIPPPGVISRAVAWQVRRRLQGAGGGGGGAWALPVACWRAPVASSKRAPCSCTLRFLRPRACRAS